MMLQQIAMIDFGSGAYNDSNQQGPMGSQTSPPTGNKGEDQMTLLPKSFCPSERDVICGRGRRVFMHSGNEHFRDTVIVGRLEEYSTAATKLEKSYILYDVVAQVRSNSPQGGFVKKDKKDDRWYEVGDFLAREKTSQAFRDVLYGKYKSSNENKKQRRLASIASDGATSTKRRRVASDGGLKQTLKKSSKAAENKAQSSICLSTPTPCSEFQAPSNLENFKWETPALLEESFGNFAFSEYRDSQQPEVVKLSIMELLTSLEGQPQVDCDPFEPTPLGVAV
jgi:hypothetical protein